MSDLDRQWHDKISQQRVVNSKVTSLASYEILVIDRIRQPLLSTEFSSWYVIRDRVVSSTSSCNKRYSYKMALHHYRLICAKCR